MIHAPYDAFILGQEAAMDGCPISDNPYAEPKLRAEWARGWTVENEEEQEHQAARDLMRGRCY